MTHIHVHLPHEAVGFAEGGEWILGTQPDFSIVIASAMTSIWYRFAVFWERRQFLLRRIRRTRPAVVFALPKMCSRCACTLSTKTTTRYRNNIVVSLWQV